MKRIPEIGHFGSYLHDLRVKHQLPLRTVADKLGIDVSMLSKIEHGERMVQAHMLSGIAEIFNLNSRELQIEFLNRKLEAAFGEEPYIEEAITKFLNHRSK